MTKDSRRSKSKNLSEKEIKTVFRKMKPAEKLLTPLPIPEGARTVSDKWIVIGGSSRLNNRLIEVSAWQTGQIS